MTSKWKPRCAALLFGLLLLAVAEGALRIAGYGHARKAGSFQFIGPELEMAEFVRDPDLFWRIRPGSPEIAVAAEIAGRNNAMGFRGRLVEGRRPPGTARIACLGDSCTYGVAVAVEQSYPERLRAALEPLVGRRVEVVNTGCPGYSSYQGLKLLETCILPLQPDVVTAYFGNWNDFVPAIGEDDEAKAERAAANELADRTREKVSGIRLVTAVADVVERLTGRRMPGIASVRDTYVEAFKRGHPPDGRRVPLPRFRSNLRAMIALCRGHGISPVLISPPLTAQAQQEFPVYLEYLNAVIEVAEAEGVALAPAATELARREAAGENVYLDWVHPNALGHEVIADLLLPVVGRLLSRDGAPAQAR